LGLALLVCGLWILYQANAFGFGKAMSYAEYQAVDANTSTAEIRKALGKPDTIRESMADAGGLQVEKWFYVESVERDDGTRCDVTFDVEIRGDHGRVTGKALEAN
jgi:hypothetical protein